MDLPARAPARDHPSAVVDGAAPGWSMATDSGTSRMGFVNVPGGRAQSLEACKTRRALIVGESDPGEGFD